MRDRVSLYPGRVKLTSVAGEADTFDLVRADAPTDVGTELSKKNLLQDSTEISLFGSAADRTVDDALAGIAGMLKLIMSDSAAITITAQTKSGNPLPGVLVQGIYSESGQALYTNENGIATGYIGEGQQTIKITGYTDIVDYSETVTVTKGTTIAKTLSLTALDFFKVTASGQVKFSGNVNTIDFTACGAGGGGQGGSCGKAGLAAGRGGWSGSVVKKTGVQIEANKNYPAIIGAGGFAGSAGYSEGSMITPAKDGGTGGSTSFLDAVASGGTGGTTNGAGNGSAAGGGTNGLPGANGADNMVFSSFTAFEKAPGGGGGGTIYYHGSSLPSGGIPGGKGGEKNGANGGSISNNLGFAGVVSPNNAPPNSGAGGGGGAAVNNGSEDMDSTNGSAGGSGFIAIRMHLKSAA